MTKMSKLGDAMLATTVTVDKPKRKGSAVKSVEVERADNNGFIVRCRYEQAEGKSSGGGIRYIEPSEHVFTDPGKMLAFVNQKMGVSATPDKKK